MVHITAEHYFLQKMSPTFQGRDLFAPVAAWFSRGVQIEKFGDPITDYRTLDIPFPQTSDGRVAGSIIHIDRFGNAISNIGKTDIESLGEKAGVKPFKVYLKDTEVRIRNHYHEAADGILCSLVNSSGCIEFFVKGGRAAAEYGISVGDEVKVVVG
ncbi:MAG: SAM-dependent chlorinase/fluorinase [Nitrospiraceae bacterium]|nr:SAM-dependent chlorinase/fluorinase [Nitrospiraceae bacterium]